MSKRRIVISSSIVLAILLVVGGTMAWFTAESDPVVNLFKTGTVKIEVNDTFDTEKAQNVNPGDEYAKLVSVTNKGSKSAFIRVKLTPEWGDQLANEVDGKLMAEYTILNGWIYHDGYYYYPEIVDAGQTTPNIIEEVKFAGKEMENLYQDKEFTLKVEAEAIQASNGAALDQWGVDPSTLVPAP